MLCVEAKEAKSSCRSESDGLCQIFSSFVRRMLIFVRRWIVGRLREIHRMRTSDAMDGQRPHTRRNVCVPKVSSIQ